MQLRPGNAVSNTVADHLTVLTAAMRQIPASSHAKILVRIGVSSLKGAGPVKRGA
ncbi:hypothetical protein ACFC01_50125 [Streptomyces mirabilis]|uniref:hypothetical protein n=1 Tax=Streptomyces mirabilis TaxID=68239 RepID=UPI0035DA30B1